MLTSQEALSEIEGLRVFPDKLTRSAHGHYVELAEEMLRIYRDGIGTQRGELHRQIERLLWSESNCPPRRIKAFCKLLDDKSKFDGSKGDDAARLRVKVFELSAEKHPLVVEPQTLLENSESDTKEKIAKRIGRPWVEIEKDLFSDVIELHRLSAFAGYPSAEALLSRYNEAQLQAVLYRATEMRVIARRDFKPIVRAAKLARLMHTAIRREDGFEFIFDGPASLLRETKRYGVAMAQVIPTLLLCEDWELRAAIPRYANSVRHPELRVSSTDRYTSSLKKLPEFDSELERKFVEKWGAIARNGWSLKHESEPRFIGQKAFFPDFVFEHEDGARILFEIVGYWTPDYLAAKRDTLQQFREEPLLLAVREDAAAQFGDLGLPVVAFKTSLKLEPLLTALEQFRLAPG